MQILGVMSYISIMAGINHTSNYIMLLQTRFWQKKIQLCTIPAFKPYNAIKIVSIQYPEQLHWGIFVANQHNIKITNQPKGYTHDSASNWLVLDHLSCQILLSQICLIQAWHSMDMMEVNLTNGTQWRYIRHYQK